LEPDRRVIADRLAALDQYLRFLDEMASVQEAAFIALEALTQRFLLG
jgi:hypothetical protein